MEILKTKILIENQKRYMKEIINSRRFYNSDAPQLAIIQVEGDCASDLYIKSKKNIGNEIGVKVDIKKFKKDVSEKEIISHIESLNCDPHVNGIIVQLPLPLNLDKYKILNSINPDKDVDGLTLIQTGRRSWGHSKLLLPCTALGVSAMIKHFERNITGKNIVIVNRSRLIGTPLRDILTRGDATVTVCHSKTKNLKDITKKADIVITATGKPCIFNHEYFNDGQMIIDCSMNHIDGKICGDVDVNDEALQKMNVRIASGAGHTGPMTVVSLMYNVIRSKILSIEEA